MNPFENLIKDIFSSKDFVEYCSKIQSGDKEFYSIPCITSSIVTDSEYTIYGLDQGINFYLMFKVQDYTPKKNDRILFKNKWYKVDNFTTDSANQSVNVYVKGISSK